MHTQKLYVRLCFYILALFPACKSNGAHIESRNCVASADFPKDQQLVAAQAAVLLLPDENREALRTLLFFLRDVVTCVDENQMTPTNIAVCLAPSLFHLNTIKRDVR